MRTLLNALFGLTALAALGGVFLLGNQLEKTKMSLATANATLAAITESTVADHNTLTTTTKNLADLKESFNRMNVVRKSQDELLTQAVAKTSPAVVSIVISKLVQQLEVTYENPFANDPFFGNLNIRVPVYRQKGTAEQQKVGAGSGFIIRSDGYIITNKHVVADQNADYTVLLSDGSQKKGTVVYRDPTNDFALVKITPTVGKKLPVIALADSSTLKLGQSVVAIGNALGEYNNSVSVGIISGLNRTIDASDSSGSVERLTGVIQTDAAINPGNSGGPLLNLDGEAVGVNVATVTGSSNISFSIPVNAIKAKIESLIK